MNQTNSLRQIMAVLSVGLMLSNGVEARTRKGDKFLKKGQTAEAHQQFDDALEFFEQALTSDPTDPGYMMAVKRARFQAGQKHVDEGQKLRAAGQLEEAIGEFQKAIARDPGSAIALQEWKRTSEMLEKEKISGKGAGPERGLTPAEKARKEAEEKAATMMAPPELQPIIRVIPSLKMNNQPPKVLYETVAKLAGINVIFDPAYSPTARNLNVEFSNSTVEQALDYLAVLTKTFWKPISSNTVFVTEDNPQKRHDYEDNVVKVFYIQNATSVQEFQEMATAVRSLTEVRRIFTYNAQRAILMRATPDQIALAEKLIHDLDKPKAEVVVDVIVMEANRSRTRSLAAAIMSGGTAGLNLPIAFTPRNPILTNGSSGTANTGIPATTTPGGTLAGGVGTTPGLTGGTTTGSTAISLSQLAHVSTNDFSTTLPGALLNLVMSDRSTKVLQSPQVRASDGQKVTLRIGDKIPYATGSFQPGVGTVGVSPLVSTQFNFAEVGVNVDITPQVHGRDEVTLKVAVEVSNVRDHVTIGGVDQPVIGQRKSETEIRLREGEVNILGGLSQTSDSKSLSGVPGLVNIPILGRLLGSENTDKERGELLIALIPHIVRTPNYSESDLKAVASGTDLTFKVTYAPSVAPPATPPPGPPSGSPEVAPAVKPPAEPKPPIPGVPAPGSARLVFLPPVVSTQVSGAISVTLQAENVQDLFSATPIRIKFDPKQLRLNEITPGELLSRDNQKVNVARDIRNDAGEASITLSRLPGASGVSGSGALATFTFTAIGKGSSPVTLTDFGLKNSQQQPIVVTPPALPVTVQ
jgi:general secretion pathway protein D